MQDSRQYRSDDVQGSDTPGLTFRCFQGAADYPLLLALVTESEQANGIFEPFRLRASSAGVLLPTVLIHARTSCLLWPTARMANPLSSVSVASAGIREWRIHGSITRQATCFRTGDRRDFGPRW